MMRAVAFAGLATLLGVLMAPPSAQGQATPCPLSGSALASEFERVIQLHVPAALHQSLVRDDRLKAQVYGYFIGRRLTRPQPAGTPYRACALALDSWFTKEFGRYSNETLSLYRAGLVGQFDWLMALNGINTDSPDEQVPAPPPKKQLADQRTLSIDAAMEAVCPTTVAPEFSQAWMTFWRWTEAEYNRGGNLFDRRWDEQRVILGHALGRVHRMVGEHPVRKVAFLCLSDHMETMIRRVSEQTRGRYNVEREKQLSIEAFNGQRMDEIRVHTGVTTSAPAATYWAQLEQDTGVDLGDGSFREAIAGPPIVTPPPAPPPPKVDPDAAAKRCAAEIIKTKRKPEFARLGVMGDTKVWIDPFENILVFIPLGKCVPWDWNEFHRDHEEKETQYKSSGIHYKVVTYRSRKTGEWVSIGYYR